MSSNFAVVNLRDGSRRDIEPLLVNNDSFPLLENAYLFRGRIERRSCFRAVGATTGRLRFSITANASGAGVFTTTLRDGTYSTGIPSGVATFGISGTVSGSPATATLTDPTGASPVTLLTTNPSITGTLNRSTGLLTISGFTAASSVTVVYYPGLPVMGLRTQEIANTLNSEQLLGFDTRWSYKFDDVTQEFVGANLFANTSNQFIWTGVDSDLFWTTNYFKALWATNNNAGYHAAQDASPVAERDGIRWFGTVSSSEGWRNFNPQLTASPTYLTGGLIIIPYQGRLVVLNTLEGADLASTVRYEQRARWCQRATPFYSAFPDGASASANVWRSDLIGNGGFVDAATGEAIVSAEFIKDTLIVYFERSTWQLVYTANETLPFIWQKINTELGTESTFSIVPFDRGVFGVGNYGIITCDSVNVARIDQKIPDEVFQIQNKNNGNKRVAGVRDYNAQLVYWTYPITSALTSQGTTYSLTFPNQVLVYNYLDNSWAQFDDTFTCFGYYQSSLDKTWATLVQSWESAQFSWNSQTIQAKYPDVVAGNQRGFVMIFSQLALQGQNTPSLEISQIAVTSVLTATLTIPDHNLVDNDYVMVTTANGMTNFNSRIFRISGTTTSQLVINGTDVSLPFSGTYTGGGFITVIPNFSIVTKDFNPFYEKGDSVRVNYIDIYMDGTSAGEITAKFFTNSNTLQEIPQDDPNQPTSPVVSTAPETATNFSSGQSRIWHRIYINAFGSFFQNEFTLSDAQMVDLNINTSDVTIHGLIYYVNAAGRVSYDI